MRLLDLISQGHTAAVRLQGGGELPSAGRFTSTVRTCPLRYLLSDDLAVCATQLAYAEGDRLSACLDLIHVPAHCVWVEWAEAPRQEALNQNPLLQKRAETGARRAGSLITAAAGCRSGSMRTFWSGYDDAAYLSPVITDFDFDRSPDPHPDAAGDGAPLCGWEAVAQLKEDPALNDLLSHLRFRFDSEWSRYYAALCATPELKSRVLSDSLAACAFDAPMLMAFFLLLGARESLPRRQVRHERLNLARRRAGKPALLEHIEVSAPLSSGTATDLTVHGTAPRTRPRLHHVRGHIVRRGVTVFWRSPHLRGSARLGQVRTRTVALSFGQPQTAAEGV